MTTEPQTVATDIVEAIVVMQPLCSAATASSRVVSTVTAEIRMYSQAFLRVAVHTVQRQWDHAPRLTVYIPHLLRQVVPGIVRVPLHIVEIAK